MVRDNHPQSRPYGTDPGGDVYTPDSLVFLLTIFLATRLGAPGLKTWSALASPILGTLVEDSTRYFLLIFTSHIVLAVTLLSGRVSTIVSF